MLGTSWYSSGTEEHTTVPVHLWDVLQFGKRPHSDRTCGTFGRHTCMYHTPCNAPWGTFLMCSDCLCVFSAGDIHTEPVLQKRTFLLRAFWVNPSFSPALSEIRVPVQRVSFRCRHECRKKYHIELSDQRQRYRIVFEAPVQRTIASFLQKADRSLWLFPPTYQWHLS